MRKHNLKNYEFLPHKLEAAAVFLYNIPEKRGIVTYIHFPAQVMDILLTGLMLTAVSTFKFIRWFNAQ